MSCLFGEFVSQALKIGPVPLRADTRARRDGVNKELHPGQLRAQGFVCRYETRTFVFKSGRTLATSSAQSPASFVTQKHGEPGSLRPCGLPLVPAV
jgi:hypothetical protein